ncbi:MAG: hypothetical protein KJ569_07040, partial [Candidatus Omnitrophica bacterium]|nr:hypothetical protein [Candidatus Omnitrophota bacterium]
VSHYRRLFGTVSIVAMNEALRKVKEKGDLKEIQYALCQENRNFHPTAQLPASFAEALIARIESVREYIDLLRSVGLLPYELARNYFSNLALWRERLGNTAMRKMISYKEYEQMDWFVTEYEYLPHLVAPYSGLGSHILSRIAWHVPFADMMIGLYDTLKHNSNYASFTPFTRGYKPWFGTLMMFYSTWFSWFKWVKKFYKDRNKKEQLKNIYREKKKQLDEFLRFKEKSVMKLLAAILTFLKVVVVIPIKIIFIVALWTVILVTATTFFIIGGVVGIPVRIIYLVFNIFRRSPVTKDGKHILVKLADEYAEDLRGGNVSEAQFKEVKEKLWNVLPKRTRKALFGKKKASEELKEELCRVVNSIRLEKMKRIAYIVFQEKVKVLASRKAQDLRKIRGKLYAIMKENFDSEEKNDCLKYLKDNQYNLLKGHEVFELLNEIKNIATELFNSLERGEQDALLDVNKGNKEIAQEALYQAVNAISLAEQKRIADIALWIKARELAEGKAQDLREIRKLSNQIPQDEKLKNKKLQLINQIWESLDSSEQDALLDVNKSNKEIAQEALYQAVNATSRMKLQNAVDRIFQIKARKLAKHNWQMLRETRRLSSLIENIEFVEIFWKTLGKDKKKKYLTDNKDGTEKAQQQAFKDMIQKKIQVKVSGLFDSLSREEHDVLLDVNKDNIAIAQLALYSKLNDLSKGKSWKLVNRLLHEESAFLLQDFASRLKQARRLKSQEQPYVSVWKQLLDDLWQNPDVQSIEDALLDINNDNRLKAKFMVYNYLEEEVLKKSKEE